MCLDLCKSDNFTAQQELPPPKQIHENYSLNLVCRDDTTLNFNIELHNTNKNPKNLLKEIKNTSQSTVKVAARKFGTFTENNGREINASRYETLFVIKIHLANDADKFVAYLVSGKCKKENDLCTKV